MVLLIMALGAHALAELWRRLKPARELCNEPTQPAAVGPAKICRPSGTASQGNCGSYYSRETHTIRNRDCVRYPARGAIGTSPTIANGRQL